MAALTYYGQAVMLQQDVRTLPNFTLGVSGNIGGFAQVAAFLRLYTTATTPSKNLATSFVEASGGGYAALPIVEANWTLELISSNMQIRLADQTFTASAGVIADVAGVYITDASGNVMAWLERSAPFTLLLGETVIVDDFTLRVS